MQRIKIKCLVYPQKRLPNSTFAVGLVTKWGTVWLTMSNLHKFMRRNPHLNRTWVNSNTVNVDDLVGRYIYIDNKPSVFFMQKNETKIYTPTTY